VRNLQLQRDPDVMGYIYGHTPAIANYSVLSQCLSRGGHDASSGQTINAGAADGMASLTPTCRLSGA
jgi:hypothetical protein